MIDLAALKNELNITYDDPRIDDKVARIISQAEYSVKEWCAVPADAEFTPAEERLVFDCCRYIYNEVFAAFESDYIATINGCRSKRLAAGFVPETGDENEG